MSSPSDRLLSGNPDNRRMVPKADAIAFHRIHLLTALESQSRCLIKEGIRGESLLESLGSLSGLAGSGWPEIKIAVTTWARENLKGLDRCSKEGAEWLITRCAETISWWGQGKPTPDQQLSGKRGDQPVHPLEWYLRFLRIGTYGRISQDDQRTLDPFEIIFQATWDPARPRNKQIEDLRRAFAGYIDKRSAQIKSFLEDFVPEPLKLAPWHYDAVALSILARKAYTRIALDLDQDVDTVRRALMVTRQQLDIAHRRSRHRA